MEATRYLAPAPAGVLSCLGLASDSDERRLFDLIVMAGSPQQVDLPAFAAALQLTPAVLARVMFSLNRNRRITVMEGAPPQRSGWVQTGLAGLSHDLVALAAPGQKLLLASADGLCVARVGWSPYEADVIAARSPRELEASQPEVWPIVVGARHFWLTSNALLDQRHPVLLQFAYRLLHGCEAPAAR